MQSAPVLYTEYQFQFFIVVSPTVNTNYSVSGASSAGFAATPQQSHCYCRLRPADHFGKTLQPFVPGQSATLTATGVKYLYTGSGANSGSMMVSPATNTVCTVSGNPGRMSGCSTNTSSGVETTPTISANSNNILFGRRLHTIAPSGASTGTYSSRAAIRWHRLLQAAIR